MKKTMKKVMALLLSFVMVFGCIPTTSNAVTVKGLDNFAKVQDYQEGMFNDVKPGDWYHENVSSVYEINLMIGRENDMFDAEENMTVAEAFTIAARLNSIYYTGKADFVQGELWYEVYTDYCKKNDIADPSKYNLDKAVTRGEFAEIFSKALPEEVLEEINKIKDGAIPDVKMNDAFSAAIYMLYRVGILTGIDEYGTFGSENSIKRMEVAAITTRMAKPSLRKTVELKEKEEEKQPEEPKQEDTKKKKKRSSGSSEQLIPNGDLSVGTSFSYDSTLSEIEGTYDGPTEMFTVEIDPVDKFKLKYTAKPGYYFEGTYTAPDIPGGEYYNSTVTRTETKIWFMQARTVIASVAKPPLYEYNDAGYKVSFGNPLADGIDHLNGNDFYADDPTNPGYVEIIYTADEFHKFTDDTNVLDYAENEYVTNDAGKHYILKVNKTTRAYNDFELTVKYDYKEIKEVDNTAVQSLEVLFGTTAGDFDGHKPEHVTVESVTPTDGGTTDTYDPGDKVVVEFKADDYYIFNKTADHYKDTFTSTSDLTVKEAVVDETQKYLTVTFEKKRPLITKILAPSIEAVSKGNFMMTFSTMEGIDVIQTYWTEDKSYTQPIYESEYDPTQDLFFIPKEGYYFSKETEVEEVTTPFENFEKNKNYVLYGYGIVENNGLHVKYVLDDLSIKYISGMCLPLDNDWEIDSAQADFIIPRHTTLVSYSPNTTDNKITVVIDADDGYEFKTDTKYYNSIYDTNHFEIKSYELTNSNKRMTFILG